MTVRINKQKINLREKLTEFEDKVNFDEVVRGLGVYPSGGNVGIGTTNPDAGLHVFSSGNGELEVERSSGAKINLQAQSAFAAIGTDSNHDFGIKSNSAVVMRLTTSGRVGIGTANPIGKLQVETASDNVYADSTQGSNFALILKNTPDLDGGSAGNNVGIAFYNYSDGNNFTRVSYISSVQELDGARYSNLVFGTDNGTGNRNEKMRITANGRVGIGHTSPGGHLHVSGLNLSIGDVTVTDSGTGVTGGTDLDTKISNGDRIKINNEIFTVSSVAATTLTLSDTPSTAGTYTAYTDNNGLIVTSAGNVGIGTTNPAQKLDVNGNIAVQGTTVHTSDDRVKHNEQNIVGAIETLGKLAPKKYIKTIDMYEANHDFQLDADGNPIDTNGEPVEHSIEAGVISQQVLEVPELAFMVSPEGVDEDGNVTSPHGLNYNSLFTYAIAAIQEQQQIIEDLKSRIETLESK